MSTQSFSFPAILFTHTQPQEAFRLLELPAELLELLSSDNAPTLYLKSSNTSADPAPTPSTTTPRTKGAQSGYVHLCTPTQTYQVRQVSTSNSLFITQSTQPLRPSNLKNAQHGEADAANEDEVALSATGALTATGQVSSVLELKAVQLDVRALLKERIPVWQWSDMRMLDVHRGSGRPVSKREFFDEIPAPDGQIEHVWRELVAFQLEGRGYVPAPETLYQAWRQVMHKFNIDGGFRAVVGAENFLEAALDDDLNDSERELVNLVKSAIWRSPFLRTPTALAVEQEDIGELDQVLTTAWVGRLVLQHLAKGDGSVHAEHFMAEWRNLLPEKWSGGLELDMLDHETYQLETNADGVRTVKWLEEDCSMVMNGVVKGKGGLESVAKDSKPGVGPVGKRKWHEKFKDSRNVKG